MSLDTLNEAIDELGPIRKDFDRHPATGAPMVTHPTDTTKSGAPKRVQYGRPSGHGNRLEDRSRLEAWKMGKVARGVAITPALVATIASLDLDDKADVKRLNAAAQQAIEAAQGNAAADIGTALHRITERVDLGTLALTDVPEVFKADVEALLAAREAAGLSVVEGMVEVHCVCDELRLAGTFDRVLTDGTQSHYIADLKTGKDVEGKQVGISVQLATYSRSMLYDVETGKRSPLEVHQGRGIIEHLPAGSGTCTLYVVDLAGGWDLAVLADKVKAEARRRDLFGPFVGGGTTSTTGTAEVVGSVEDNQPSATTPDSDSGEAADREAAAGDESPSATPSPESPTLAAVQHEADTAWALNRCDAVREAGHLRTLHTAWPEDTPKPGAVRKGEAWTPEQLDRVIEALDRTEARWEMPFGTERPSVTAARTAEAIEAEPAKVHTLPHPDDNSDEQASDDNVRALRRILESFLADEEYRPRGEAVLRWGSEALRQSRPFAMGDPDAERPTTTSERRYRICLAALDCATELLHPTHDEPEFGVRLALATVIGEDLQPTWTTGAVLGSLTTEQAIRLADIASTHRSSILEDGTPQLTAAA